MDIEIVKYKSESDSDSTKFFGIILSKALSIIHMVHWYVPNFQAHEILGDLYGTLDGLFDKLQEEIIGTSKLQGKTFPSFSPDMFSLNNLDQFDNDLKVLIDTYNLTKMKLVAMLDSEEFSVYVQGVCSGINNTKEDILSAINKADYLLSMVQF